MNFIAGETSSHSLDEAFPNRIEHSSKVSLFFVGAKQRVTRGGKAKRPSRFWELSLCTPSARSDTSSYWNLFCRSCGPGPDPRGPAQP